jgi:hypothetical protein
MRRKSAFGCFVVGEAAVSHHVDEDGLMVCPWWLASKHIQRARHGDRASEHMGDRGVVDAASRFYSRMLMRL